MAMQPNMSGQFLRQDQALLAFSSDEISMGRQALEGEEVSMGVGTSGRYV